MIKVLAAILAFAVIAPPAFAQEKKKPPPKPSKPKISWYSAKRLQEYLREHPNKQYVLLHAFSYRDKSQRVEIPHTWELVKASRAEWLFTYLYLDNESSGPVKKLLGLENTPMILATDRHLNVLSRSEDRSLSSIQTVMRRAPLEEKNFKARLKAEYDQTLASLKQDDPKDAVQKLVEFILKHKGDSPEMNDALAKLKEYATEDFQKAELAMSLSAEKGAEYLRGMVDLYKTTPPGVKAELQIAKLEMEAGESSSAVIRLRRISANYSPDVSEERKEAMRILHRLKEHSPEVLAKAEKPVEAPKPKPHVEKTDVPSAEALKEPRKIIQDLFKDDYARAQRSSGERLKLAQKLLQEGRRTEGDAAAQYVLFDEARDLAAQAGDAVLALSIVDEILARFNADEVKLRNDTLDRAGSLARTPEAIRAVAEGYLTLIESAIAEDDYTSASNALTKANSIARKARDSSMLAQIKELTGYVSDLRREYYRVRTDHAKLKENPDDPGANLSYGMFLCLVKGDWHRGLPLLAKGSDAKIKALAAMDLADPAEPTDQVKVADGWWDMAEKERSDTRKECLVDRAQHWYERALEKLTGLSKLKVENRLEEIVKASKPRYSSSAPAVNLLTWINPKLNAVHGGGQWRFNRGALVSPYPTEEVRYARIMVPCAPPAEYDLGLKVEKKHSERGAFYIGLVGEGHQFVVMLDNYTYTPPTHSTTIGYFGGVSMYGKYLARKYPSEKINHVGAVLKPSKPVTIICYVRKKSLKVTIDGNTVIEWKNPVYNIANTGERLVIPHKGSLFLGCEDVATFEISGLTLKPLSGRPRKIVNTGGEVIAPFRRR